MTAVKIMEKTRTAKRKIIFESYKRLVLLSMVVACAANLCGFIDNIVISRFLGDAALAAVGYFSPVMAVSGLLYVIIVGTSMMSGNFIGSGQRDKVNSLFTGSFFSLL